jgi:hypothetical protein
VKRAVRCQSVVCLLLASACTWIVSTGAQCDPTVSVSWSDREVVRDLSLLADHASIYLTITGAGQVSVECSPYVGPWIMAGFSD